MPDRFGGGDRLYGLPIPVHFAGFQSDTQRLGRAGWKLLSDYDIARMRHRFVFRNERMNLWGMAEDYFLNEALRFSHLPPIIVGPQRVAQDIIIQGEVPAYQWVDMNTSPELMPEVDYMNRVRMSGLFPPANDDVYVEEADHDVLDYLQKIVEMQRPKQAELREKANKTNKTIVQPTAQIIQLGAYR